MAWLGLETVAELTGYVLCFQASGKVYGVSVRTCHVGHSMCYATIVMNMSCLVIKRLWRRMFNVAAPVITLVQKLLWGAQWYSGSHAGL